MTFNLTGLSAYVDQTGQTDLITRAVLQPQTVGNLTVKAGLTAGTTNLNILGATANILDAACGFGAAQVGTNATVFTELPIVVKAKMLKETLCPDTLYDVWLSSQLSASANHESVPFEAAIADLKIKEINKYIEQTIWAGDGADLDGLKSQLSVIAGAVDGSSVASAWEDTDSVANMWTLIDLIPDEVKQEDDLIAFVSYKTYSKLVQGLMAVGNAILQQYPNISNVAGQAESSFIFPGTNVKVFAAPGLTDETGESTVFIGPKKYVYFGTGLLDDKDTFKMFYDESDDEVKFSAKFKLGTAAVANQFVSTLAGSPS
jgi:hypothetical protein